MDGRCHHVQGSCTVAGTERGCAERDRDVVRALNEARAAEAAVVVQKIDLLDG